MCMYIHQLLRYGMHISRNASHPTAMCEVHNRTVPELVAQHHSSHRGALSEVLHPSHRLLRVGIHVRTTTRAVRREGGRSRDRRRARRCRRGLVECVHVAVHAFARRWARAGFALIQATTVSGPGALDQGGRGGGRRQRRRRRSSRQWPSSARHGRHRGRRRQRGRWRRWRHRPSPARHDGGGHAHPILCKWIQSVVGRGAHTTLGRGAQTTLGRGARRGTLVPLLFAVVALLYAPAALFCTARYAVVCTAAWTCAIVCTATWTCAVVCSTDRRSADGVCTADQRCDVISDADRRSVISDAERRCATISCTTISDAARRRARRCLLAAMARLATPPAACEVTCEPASHAADESRCGLVGDTRPGPRLVAHAHAHTRAPLHRAHDAAFLAERDAPERRLSLGQP